MDASTASDQIHEILAVTKGEHSEAEFAGRVEIVSADLVPEPQKGLLVHGRDMTRTLEAFCGGTIHLEPLRMLQVGDELHRRVVLMADEAPVEFGAIRIHLGRFDTDARNEILAGKRPLGAILHMHSVEHECRPRAFFQFDPDPEIWSALQLQGRPTLYGRYTDLFGSGDKVLAEAVEILPPFGQDDGGADG